MKIDNDEFVRDVSSYEKLEDLMIASDILISDYSSIFFDYSIMDKIMFHFTYDYEKYCQERGLYFDIRGWLNGSDNEDMIIDLINNIDEGKEKLKTQQFKNEFLQYYGDASKKCVDLIADKIF